MSAKTKATKKYTPSSVPIVSQAKIYYSSDVQTAGGMDAFLKSVGSDRAKTLPQIDFSEQEWEYMLKEEE